MLFEIRSAKRLIGKKKKQKQRPLLIRPAKLYKRILQLTCSTGVRQVNLLPLLLNRDMADKLPGSKAFYHLRSRLMFLPYLHAIFMY